MPEYRLDEIIAATKQVILESLEQDDKGYGLATRLVDDLGAESLDFLDMVFRLEKRFKVKIERGRAERRLRERLPHANVKQNSEITPEIAQTLKELLPEIDGAEIDGIRKMRQLSRLFTIATFVRLTIEALYDTNPNTVIDASASDAYRPEQLGMTVTS
jgi:acyl carrier protein